MIIKYLTYSISISFISWIVGMIGNAIFRKNASYKNFSHLNFIKSEALNKSIGLQYFKWIVKNTFFKYFNANIRSKNKIDLAQLHQLRLEMTYSEISHLIGFGFVAIFALVKFIKGEFLFGLIMMIVNTLMNLYPSLLQQANKRRIDRLIRIFG